MARTPLLRALQRLAHEHRQAEGLGISPGELREREAEHPYSRSEFLKRSGAVGAAKGRVWCATWKQTLANAG